MKQKYFYLCFISLLSGVFLNANAQTIEVKSLDSFSTAKPPASISVELLEPLILSKDNTLESGTKVKGNLYDVVSPRRLKRDADFSFIPVSYIDKNGKV